VEEKLDKDAGKRLAFECSIDLSHDSHEMMERVERVERGDSSTSSTFLP